MRTPLCACPHMEAARFSSFVNRLHKLSSPIWMSKIQRFGDTGPGKASYTDFIGYVLKCMRMAVALIH